MIPLHLSIAGFLSYREPAELDFTTFDLACIAGANGAGKSSLLDAITWVLFGQARKRDDSIINAQSNTARVCMIFEYEGNIYRVERVKPRDKTAVLEFHILQSGSWRTNGASGGQWKPLTERTLRETDACIQKTLRMDYETFVNAAFFLQGKADQFTQQRPGDRKRILSSILGLEIWEAYRQQAADRRKLLEADISNIEGRLFEISNELAEEKERRERLERLEKDLERLSRERFLQESALENIRKNAAALAEQRRLVNAFERQLENMLRRVEDLQHRREARLEEKQSFQELLARAEEIEAAYAAWQAARQELERWDEIAGRFREHEKRREEPRAEINAAHARLMQELETLQAQEKQVAAVAGEIAGLEEKIRAAQGEKERLEAQLEERDRLDEELRTARDQLASANAENPLLKKEMNELNERIKRLRELEGATCPFCGQPLSPEERMRLVDKLQAEGTAMGDRYRANQKLKTEFEQRVANLVAQINQLSKSELALRSLSQTLAQLNSRLEMLTAQRQTWEEQGARRLKEVQQALENEDFAHDARRRLAEIDDELRQIGYDAAEHDRIRQAEMQGRAAQEDLLALEKARGTLESLEREIADLDEQLQKLQTEVDSLQQEYDQAAAALAAAEAQAPDVAAAEQNLFMLQEQENRLRIEVGAAQQKVLVLEDLKTRRRQLEAERDEIARQVQQYRQLERAFGKDGIPALLIEQALPEIEARSNEILDRLSGGNMSVRFVTQAAYKDKHRDDLRETLEIQISDSAGTRDYEMFSGGEAFRVDFAIRLALSEVLSQRAGARLQTLVIDEGFGSQDNLGRQRLLEAINLVRSDFAKILVITHIDELKEAFPNRIEVEKTPLGSRLRVI